VKKLILALMLSILVVGFGTAYAITGVADDVPGEAIVFPMICEGYQPTNASGTPEGDPVFGSLNTVWAIAETTGVSCTSDDSVCTPKEPSVSKVGVVKASVIVNDKYSITKWDSTECWSKWDVISDSCQTIVSQMDPSARKALEVPIEGINYFVGEVLYITSKKCDDDVENPLVGWVYLNDIGKGFAAGYNGVSIENGLGAQLEEECTDGSCNGQYIGITASMVFPRYFILNSNPDTWTWWIFLAGRNEYQLEAKLNLYGGVPTVPDNNMARYLVCFFCDEGEKCQSNSIPLPYELNIIYVKPWIPGGVYSAGTWPKAGFAACTIYEHGFFTGQTTETVINGTLSFDDNLDTDSTPETYTLLGWSYQRAKPSTGNAYISVIHPVHRLYCDGDDGDATELPNRFNSGTVLPCTIDGFELHDVTP